MLHGQQPSKLQANRRLVDPLWLLWALSLVRALSYMQPPYVGRPSCYCRCCISQWQLHQSWFVTSCHMERSSGRCCPDRKP